MANVANNLPQQLTSFIGREREITEVRRLLGEARLVTLTGPGGTGKTRLALEIAYQALALFPNGVWLVELATLSEREMVPQAVAAVLGVREESERNLLATLAEHLRSRKLLLVLDNCEHLLTTCAQLAQTLLRAAPDLYILATSRHLLGLEGECVWNVPPLAVPPVSPLPPIAAPLAGASSERASIGSPVSIERASTYEAVRLFVDRACLRRPDFALSDRNVLSVVRLCQRLDGLPLAIELAAARTRALSVEELFDRLDERFRLLTSTSGTLEPRHRTLTALMDWSYDLLSAREQALFREMSVFAGGCTLEALREVCGTFEGEEEWETIELVTQLADKSLVIVEHEEEGGATTTRYRMLETIRQYAWEKLQLSGQAVDLRNRHLRYYLTLADLSQDELLGVNQRPWLERLEREHDNLRAALIWSHVGSVGVADSEPEAGFTQELRLAGALVWFWFFRGYITEGRTELEAALQNAGQVAQDSTQAAVQGEEHRQATGNGERIVDWAKVLTAAGALAFLQGDYAAARSRLEEGLNVWRQLGDERGTAFTLTFLARVAKRQGSVATARTLGEESASLFRRADEKWGLALSLDFLGEVARDTGDQALAAALNNESLALYQELGHRWGVALELSSFGQAAMLRGDYASARSRLEQAVAIQREVGDKWTLAWTLRSLARTIQSEGDRDQAESLYEESLAIFNDLNDQEGIALTSRELSSLTGFGPGAQVPGPISSQGETTRRPAAHDATGAMNEEVRVAELTGREVEVLQLVAEGLTDAQIAERLCLSVRTVQSHVRSIYTKLDVNTRSAATRYAMQHRLV